ncbi:MAG: SIS domain-containing protein [Planctomycetes bacterium]|nr:SIS domain-containing protein [Planctomycetota bacterium]
MKSVKHSDTILAELQRVLNACDQSEADALAEMISSAGRIFIAGHGRSGLIARAFAMRLVHLGHAVFVVGEPTASAIEAGDLLIVASGKGDNKSLTKYVEQAARAGARCAAVTATPECPVAALAELAVVLPAAKSQQFGGSLFEQALLIFLDSLVMQIADQSGITHNRMAERHANLE